MKKSANMRRTGRCGRHAKVFKDLCLSAYCAAEGKVFVFLIGAFQKDNNSNLRRSVDKFCFCVIQSAHRTQRRGEVFRGELCRERRAG